MEVVLNALANTNTMKADNVSVPQCKVRKTSPLASVGSTVEQRTASVALGAYGRKSSEMASLAAAAASAAVGDKRDEAPGPTVTISCFQICNKHRQEPRKG